MRKSLLFLAITTAASAVPVRADVLEIADDGSVEVLADSPLSVWTPDGEDASTEIAVPALTPIGGRTFSGGYAEALEEIARAFDISPHLLEAVVWQESRWNPAAVSPVGAIGLAQLMPATARELGVDPRDPYQNLVGGARYLRQQLDRFDGNLEKALAAYNAGPARVMRAGGVPNIRETQDYVRAIVARLASATEFQGGSQ